jgi:hypothetical protein
MKFLQDNWDKLWSFIVVPAFHWLVGWHQRRLQRAEVRALILVMPADTHGRFLRRVVQDLIGLVEVLYRGERDGEGNPIRLQQLADIGRTFKLALELAGKCGPGTLGRRAAWDHAENATASLGGFVADDTPIAPAVRAAAARLTRGR